MQPKLIKDKSTLLILGGTGEALSLMSTISEQFGNQLRIIYSLAGCTKKPVHRGGEIRIGGFGGIKGLQEFLYLEKVKYLIDATHPFAKNISANALFAAKEADIPYIYLNRKEWSAGTNDQWHHVEDISAAAEVIPKLGVRVFLTLGPRALEYFKLLNKTWFLVRLIDKPEKVLPLLNAEIILDRGPFNYKSEFDLLVKYKIDVIVTRASGGKATFQKLLAARELQVPVIMIRRPPLLDAESATSKEEFICWLNKRINFSV